MKKRLDKIWKDPVISKVIATGIIAFITIVYNYASSIFNETSFQGEFIDFWTLDVKLWQIFILVLIILLLYLSKLLFGFSYDDKTLNLDVSLFNRIRNELLTQEIILESRDNGYSTNPFEHEKLDFIHYFLEEGKKSNFEFMNPKLETKKKKLVLAVDNFHTQISKYIFGTNNPDWLSIPKEWAQNDRERYDKAVLNISIVENELTSKYDDFIRGGRRVLKV